MNCRNSEYYADPTAERAIANVMREQRRERRERLTGEQSRVEIENWEALANAIILQAVEDYRKARSRVRMMPDQKEAQRRIREVERFFESEWFHRLADTDGKRILEYLKKEIVR